MPEGCPTCGVSLVWMRVKPPASLGFCEGCGAWWMHQPDKLGQEVADCTDAAYEMMRDQGLPVDDHAAFRADNVEGRMIRMGVARRIRAERAANGSR